MRMGEHYGLALYPNGEMIDGTGYGIGSFEWNPDPRAWVNGRFVWGFTTHGPAEPYNNGEHDLIVPEGYREDNRGAAVTPDGTAWWVSLHTGLSSYNHAIGQNNGAFIRHYTDVPGLPTTRLMDIAADPDGSLWIVDGGGRLLRFSPTAQTAQVWPGVSNVRRVVMDTTVTPRALYVSMGNQGLAVIRAN
jgi:sugar lactone lactonase YvrE